MLEILRLPMLSDNYSWLIRDPATGTSGVVDPAEAPPVLAKLRELGRGLDWILATHHHGDHIGGIAGLKAATGCKVVGPAKDAARIPGLDQGVVEGDTFAFGSRTARILETPGHTRGHIAFWFEADDALFCGDTLFALGCGRAFEGDGPTMWASLARLRALPDATRVCCGHEYTLGNARFALTVDPGNAALQARARTIEAQRQRGEPTVPSQLGEEKATNPFLRPEDPAIRRQLGLERAEDAAVFWELRERKNRG